jgi:hypothetical protein
MEDCFRTISRFSMPSDLFPDEDVLNSPPLLFSSGDITAELSSDSDLDSDLLRSTSPTEEMIRNAPPPPPMEVPRSTALLEKKVLMEKFPLDKVSDFKHVIYNLLVDHYNNPELVPFIEPVEIVLDGELRTGFRFSESYNPEKRLPELYAQHIRRARLDLENQDSIFIQDLYKFYLRAVLELLAKYFEKCDKVRFIDFFWF